MGKENTKDKGSYRKEIETKIQKASEMAQMIKALVTKLDDQV